MRRNAYGQLTPSAKSFNGRYDRSAGGLLDWAEEVSSRFASPSMKRTAMLGDQHLSLTPSKLSSAIREAYAELARAMTCPGKR
jgi:hypothetical protein